MFKFLGCFEFFFFLMSNKLMLNKSVDMIFRFFEFGLIILGWLNSNVRFLQ